MWVWIVSAVTLICVVVVLAVWHSGDKLWNLPEASVGKGAVRITGVTGSIEGRIQNELLLQGFLRQGRDYIAIINDQIVSSDDVLSVELGTRTYQLRVKAIEEGRIILAVL